MSDESAEIEKQSSVQWLSMQSCLEWLTSMWNFHSRNGCWCSIEFASTQSHWLRFNWKESIRFVLDTNFFALLSMFGVNNVSVRKIANQIPFVYNRVCCECDAMLEHRPFAANSRPTMITTTKFRIIICHRVCRVWNMNLLTSPVLTLSWSLAFHIQFFLSAASVHWLMCIRIVHWPMPTIIVRIRIPVYGSVCHFCGEKKKVFVVTITMANGTLKLSVASGNLILFVQCLISIRCWWCYWHALERGACTVMKMKSLYYSVDTFVSLGHSAGELLCVCVNVNRNDFHCTRKSNQFYLFLFSHCMFGALFRHSATESWMLCRCVNIVRLLSYWLSESSLSLSRRWCLLVLVACCFVIEKWNIQECINCILCSLSVCSMLGAVMRLNAANKFE